jgi:hypothetical protein
MLDEATPRPCPHCETAINWAATRCGHCWQHVTPLTKEQAIVAAGPHTNHREAQRLVRERDAATVEALLDERDRLREGTAGAPSLVGAGTPGPNGEPRPE